MTSIQADLSQCEREPIHIPGSIQPHGLLFALREADLKILQVSRNTEEVLERPLADILGQTLGQILGQEAEEQVRSRLVMEQLEVTPLYVATWQVGSGEAEAGRYFNAVVHRRGGFIILELERTTSAATISFSNLYPLVRTSIARFEKAASWVHLCELAAQEVRRVTGFDKVMLYRFDDEWHGTVIAEEKSPGMDAYLDLRFPASDIPRQARDLYLMNRLRLIANVDYEAVPILPVLNVHSGRPLDLSLSLLRSVSPVHLEYLRNMGVCASMSISIIRDNRLWGLIACHHTQPRYLPFEVRTACEFLGQVLGFQIAASEERELNELRLQMRPFQARLLESMARAGNFADGLGQQEYELLALADAAGAAVISDNECLLVGQTPSEAEVRRLADWVHGGPHGLEVEQGVSHTDALPLLFPEAAAYKNVACGVMALSVSRVNRTYVLWFRPEVVQTVRWGGNPNKPVEQDASQLRLHPRKSFEVWKESVSNHALPWMPHQIEAASELRGAITGIVLRQAEERAKLSAELERSNKELEAFSYSVSHDLRAPFRHITGLSKLLQKRAGDKLDATSLRYIESMSDAAYQAGTLVDSLLEFSQMGRSEMHRMRIDMSLLVNEVRRDLTEEMEGRTIDWRIQKLPTVQGDLVMMRLVWQNLISNAIKYTRKQPNTVIEIGAHSEEDEIVFFIRDNGAGFDMRHVGKLFGVFERLHRDEDFEGTGIGLANVRRIVTRHGGRTWAEGVVEQGAAFFFSLPQPGKKKPASATETG